MRSGKIAVIDIGSNSARLVIFRAERGSNVEVLWDERSALRLARGLREGQLTDDSIERTVAVLRDFRSLVQGVGVDQVLAVATSAVREARNGADLLERLRREAEIDVTAISGAEEGRLAFLGAIYALPVQHGILIDLGGGSLEVSRFRDRRFIESWTLPVGALRVSDAFLHADPPSASQMKALSAHVRTALADAGIGRLADDEVLIGSGGTIRNIAKMCRERSDHPIHRLHGQLLGETSVAKVLREASGRRLADRAKIDGLNADRADSIVGGTIVVDRVMRATKAAELLVSGSGMREGLVLSQAFQDDLPEPAVVRGASVAALAARFARSAPVPAAGRAGVASGFLRVAAGEVPPRVTEMLHHASSLLGIGRAIDFYNRYEHTADVVLGADLAGFSHPDIAMLAMTICAAGREGVSLRAYRDLLPEGDRVWILRAGLALAIAEEVEARLVPLAFDALTWESDGEDIRPVGADLADWRMGPLPGRCERLFGLGLRP